MIKTIKENIILDNGFIKVYNDTVSFNGKSEGNYFKYSLSDKFPNYGVAIICEYEEKIYLQEIFRYAHQDKMIETVKGMGMKDKTPLETATIEVREETGGIIDSIKEIGIIKNDLSDCLIHCFVAKIKNFEDTNHEESEFIENLKGYSILEIKEMIINDELQDGLTMSIILKYLVNIT